MPDSKETTPPPKGEKPDSDFPGPDPGVVITKGFFEGQKPLGPDKEKSAGEVGSSSKKSKE